MASIINKLPDGNERSPLRFSMICTSFTGNYNDVFRVNIYLYRNSILWQEIKVLPELLMHESKAYLLYTETEPETAQYFVFYDLWSVVNLIESKQISFGFIQLRW